MMLPLYEGNNAPRETGKNANKGLWYDKFCSVWIVNEPGKWNMGADSKTAWINSVTGTPVGDQALIDEMKKRLSALINMRNGKMNTFRTQGRFITGIGREHPVENGFSWHHTLGAPFLPGSSVKGLVRSWAKVWIGEEPKIVDRIFGPDGSEGRQVGSVVFFDALPVKPVKLKADVMTPHYQGYYQKNGGPPADWYSPVPISFLTVSGGQSFAFAIAPRRSGNESDKSDMEKAVKWLEEALASIGAGAKTSIGYGRFIPVTE